MAPFAFAQNFYWPTPMQVDAKTPWQEIVQPAASGKPETGLFGLARNSGSRFHEGLDIRPVQRDKKGEPTDIVKAVAPGTVAHIAPTPNGAYGRYIVLTHYQPGITFYTLYAHLQSIAPGLKEGATIKAGQNIGIMGRSDASGGFPKERAHLHFEVGVRLSDSFNNWYSRQKDFTTPNRHSIWNGRNLSGTDPLPFLGGGLLYGRAPDLAVILKNEPVAVTALVATTQIPDFVRINPTLVNGPIPKSLAGWKVEFAWHGLPFRWTPLTVAPGNGKGVKSLTVTSDQTLRERATSRKLITQNKKNFVSGSTLTDIINILFDW
jgi:hypothetical protein